MRLFYFFAITAMLNLLPTITRAQNLNDYLPDSLQGWDLAIDDRKYSPETLYDYIDGGAELYLSYGMKEVICRIYKNEKQEEIRVEVFDMVKPEDAFGVFSHTRDKDEKLYGQGSQYFTGTLIFWKDHYYVSITANDENEVIRESIHSLALQIDKKISTTGNLPDIINMLPLEGLQQDAYIFFHHYIWLNSHYYIADDNFLAIDENTQAVLAGYGDKENRVHLLLINYPDALKAEQAHQNFIERFLDNPGDRIAKIEDGSWLGTTINDRLLICVFNAKSAEETESYLHKVSK